MKKPYDHVDIEKVRKDVIGLKVTDFEDDGKIIHLKDKSGRHYMIDNTGSEGAIVSAGTSTKDKINELEELVNKLINHLDIDVDSLYEKP